MRSIAVDIEEAARFGGEGTGVTRGAWSAELAAVNAWLVERIEELGLEPHVDAAGNVFGRWQAGEGPPVLVGSHLDTVPRGGRYDGALGVLSGLQAIRHLQQWGVQPRRPLWLVSWMDEEGARFKTSMLGSKAFVGEDVSSLGDRRDAGGVSVREAMEALGFDFARIGEARGIDGVGAYLELHIEQGPVLETSGIDIGVVTAIVGLHGFRARVTGEANHAGTTPMRLRRDAFAGAARVALELRDVARRTEGMTANVGIVQVEPGGFNVVPAVCTFTIDVRSASREGYEALEGIVRETVARVCEEEGLGWELETIHRLDPVPTDPAIQQAIEDGAAVEGATSLRLPSGAGHDAQILGSRVPAGMLFVPSRGGISHNPDEFTSPEHCALGARVLARALGTLVG
ncbi:MAG: M20 family metallo-hydrolase [Thermoleophilia bacterium]